MSCNPLVFGPYNQTLFLGCSVIDFACSIGWNEQSSQLTTHLVQDTCTAPAGSGKLCYDLETKAALGFDLNLNEVTTLVADPGFTEPTPGTPVYFRMGPNFEFGGIVQSWMRTNSEGGNPTYSVTINDPREVLSECQFILDEYVGGVALTSNVFNVYGYCELFGGTCAEALLPDLTGPGAFGGSNISAGGMTWNRIKRAGRILTSVVPNYTTSWSPYGRIRFRGHDYLLDWSELPYIPYYRVQASSISILDLISQVASDAGLDYYIELLFGVEQSNPNNILNMIKVRTVSRVVQPALGQIAAFLEETDGTIETQYGQELRNEHTSSVLIGGNKIGLFEQVANYEYLLDEYSPYYNRWDLATIWPYWGKHADGGVIIGEGINEDHHFTINLRHLNIVSEDGKKRISGYTIYIDELHAVLAGKDVWLSYFIEHHDDVASIIGNGINPVEFLNLTLDGVHVSQNNGAFMPHDVINFRKKNISKRVSWQDVQTSLIQIEKLFRIVERYATQFYGQQFMVRMWDVANDRSFVCVKQDPQSGQLLYSLDIADAGWTDAEAGVLGVVNPLNLDVFRQDDRRIVPFAGFNEAGNLLIPDLDFGDFVFQDLLNTDPDGNPNEDLLEQIGTVYGQQLFVKTSLESEYVFVSDGYGNFNLDDPRTVVTLPSVFQRRVEAEVDSPFFVGFMFNEVFKNNREWATATKAEQQSILRDMLTRAGSTSVHYGYDNLRLIPNKAVIPLQSNIETYGPWFAYGASGKTRYEKNNDLTPWSYGNSTSMSAAGSLLASTEITNMQVSEVGFVEVPGLPALQLGAELRSGAASLHVLKDILLNNDNDGLGEERAAEIAMTQWNGLFGPNITDIEVSMGPNGVTTRYSLRTFTPTYGRFSKQNAERLKIRGLLANKNKKDARDRFLGRVKDSTATFSRDISNQLMRERQNLTGFFARTPHQVLVGQQVGYSGAPGSTGSFYRAYAHTQSLAEATNEMSDYANKHLMSLDGLIRPFRTSSFQFLSTQEDAGPLRYTPTVLPPVVNDDYHNMPITAQTTNPFLNPNSRKPKYPLGTNKCGHSIEYIARGTGLPEDMCIHHDNEYAEDVTDYRGLCLTGPLVLTAWGFDTNGKPVPNLADEDSEDPIFSYARDGSDQFMTNWLKRPDKWKTGMVDLRWDANRGMWTSFPGFRMVRAITCDPLEAVGVSNYYTTLPTKGKARLVGYNFQVGDKDNEEATASCCGGQTGDTVIEVQNIHQVPIYAGTQLLCYYDDTAKEYYPVFAPQKVWTVSCIGTNALDVTSGYEFGNIVYGYEEEDGCKNPRRVKLDFLSAPWWKGSAVRTIAVTLENHTVIQTPFYPTKLISDVDCVELSSPGGVGNALVVCDRIVWTAGFCDQQCPDDGTTVATCTNLPFDIGVQ